MSTNENESRLEEKKKKRKKLWILLIIIGLLLFSIPCAIYTINVLGKSANSAPVTQNPVLDNNGNSADGKAPVKSQEEVLKELQEKQLMITDKISSNISFPSGKKGTTGKWMVENSVDNKCIQQVEVHINGKDLITKTTPIFPNQHISKVELQNDVQPGNYDAIATINYFALDTKEFISKVEYQVKLTIS